MPVAAVAGSAKNVSPDAIYCRRPGRAEGSALSPAGVRVCMTVRHRKHSRKINHNVRVQAYTHQKKSVPKRQQYRPAYQAPWPLE